MIVASGRLNIFVALSLDAFPTWRSLKPAFETKTNPSPKVKGNRKNEISD
jgi:hypothetical protein